MNNSLTKSSAKPTFSNFITADGMKAKINQMIGSEKGQSFITSIISAVSANPQLATCDNSTIVSAALVGASLNLSPSNQLGHFYLVPFNDRKNNRTVAQFQLGYKGYIQLAMRSGQYKKLNVVAIKDGELLKYDPLNEEIEVNLIDDDEVRENTETIGYYAMFEYLNGFRKTLYWSKKKMKSHAVKYSQGYASDVRNGNAWTFWSKDFDGMAFKTMLRQLISKWGIMSIEMQKAFESDMGVIHDDGKIDYVDNSNEFANVETGEIVEETPEVEQVKPKQSKTNKPTQESIFQSVIEQNVSEYDGEI